MKPILFSEPMVQALLNTKPGVYPAEPIDARKPCKSQTRRVMKFEAPYRYQPDDILWVRETWKCVSKNDEMMEAVIEFKADGTQKSVRFDNRDRYDKCVKGMGMWKSSRFMLIELPRLFLEVKAVRVELVQDITEADAKAEGVLPMNPLDLKKAPLSLFNWGKNGHGTLPSNSCKASFYRLWDKLNAKRGYSWNSNPWVLVYEFMRKEDQ